MLRFMQYVIYILQMMSVVAFSDGHVTCSINLLEKLSVHLTEHRIIDVGLIIKVLCTLCTQIGRASMGTLICIYFTNKD